MRTLVTLTIVPLAALTLCAAALAQTAQQPSTCCVETWSTDKMAYETTPCASGTTEENPAGTTR